MVRPTCLWLLLGVLLTRVLAGFAVPGAAAAGAVLLEAAGVVVLLAGLGWLGRRGARRLRTPPPRGGGDALRSAVALSVTPLVDSAALVGVVVGTVDGSGRCDHLACGPPAHLDDRTVLEIGSITKALTGTLLADLVLEGVVRLDLEVRAVLPLPQLSGVTLLDLATHRSGLPTLPRRLGLLSPLSTDPYRWVDEQRLLAGVPAPGPGRQYSNLGFALLGLALARCTGTPYAELLEQRVLRPLGIQGRVGAAAQARGHDVLGVPVPPWHLSAYAPAGGVGASIADLLRLAQALLDPPDSAVGRALRLAVTPHAPLGGTAAVGLGWHLDADLVWHNGGTAGMYAYLGVRPGRGRGVAMVATSAPRDRFDLAARQVLRAVSLP